MFVDLGNVRILDLLLKTGVNINAEDDYPNSKAALHYAAREGN